MKLIIAGSRDLQVPVEFIDGCLFTFKFPTELVSGCAKGIDECGLNWAKTQNSGNFPIKKFYPDWGTHGKKAGPIRNKQMAEYADELLLIWDGESKGSKNMKEEMLKLNKPVYEFIIKQY